MRGTVLRELGLGKEWQTRAAEIWKLVTDFAPPKIRKPAVYVAAMDYVIRNEAGIGAPQAAVAREHGVSAGSLCRAIELIETALRVHEIEHRDDPHAPITIVPPNSKSPVEWSAAERKQLRELPILLGTTFYVGRAKLPKTFIDGIGQIEPEILVWAELDARIIRTGTLIVPTAPPIEAANTIFDAMLRPLAGDIGRPETIAFADDQLRAMLEPAVRNLGITVEAGDPAVVAEIAKLLVGESEVFGAEDPDAAVGYLADGLTADDAKRLFQAAKKLVRLAPWTFMNDSQIIAADFRGAFGREKLAISVMGNLGELFALGIYDSLAEFAEFYVAAYLRLDEDESSPLTHPPVESTMLAMVTEAQLTATQIADLRAHNWPIQGPTWIPQVLRVGPTGTHVVGGDDVRVATICAEIVTAFAANHRRLLQSHRPSPVTVEVPIAGIPGLPTITVTGPFLPTR